MKTIIIRELNISNLDDLFEMDSDPENKKSKRVLYKIGFKHNGTFDYDGYLIDWFEITNLNE